MNLNIRELLKDFHGSYLIEAGNEKLIGSNGYANLTYQFENRTNTSYGTASTGKIFTAIAIMQLIEKTY